MSPVTAHRSPAPKAGAATDDGFLARRGPTAGTGPPPRQEGPHQGDADARTSLGAAPRADRRHLVPRPRRGAHGRRRSWLFYTLTNVPQALRTCRCPEGDDPVLRRLDAGHDRAGRPHHRPSCPRYRAQVRWAVLAAEDRGFYSESAVSIKGTVRAALSDVTGGDTQGGFRHHPAVRQERLPHQLADPVSRKLKELMIAVKLTRDYTKNQILELLPEHGLLRPRDVRHPGRGAVLLR